MSNKEEQTRKLIEIIKKTNDESIKFKAIDELGEIGKRAKQAVSLLVSISNDSSESFNLRSKAIWSLGEIGSGAAVQKIINLLKSDNNENIRILCIEALGKIGKRSELILPALKEIIFSETDSKVRNRIPKVLRKFEDAAILILIEVIKKSSPDLQYYSLLALGEIKNNDKEISSFLYSGFESADNIGKVGYGFALLIHDGYDEQIISKLEELKQMGFMTLGQRTTFEEILKHCEVKINDLNIDILDKINRILSFKNQNILRVRNFNDLIKRNETNQIEFKAALRYNNKKQKVLPDLEKKIIKTIVGFMNADGGILLIGVNNYGKIVGLDGDYSTFGDKQNNDGFRLHLTQLYRNNNILVQTNKCVRPFFPKINEKEFCIVTVEPSNRPVFVNKDLIVRMDNSTRTLSTEEAVKYINDHFNENQK
ncbi:MAG: hypothetical protein FK733_14550 [Asgard group archaeon]|nr:hypothetical protein [Asgard group archaeon]